MHTSHLEGGYTPSHAITRNRTSFAEQFKALRKQLVGKQACLSGAGLRCTDAAISHWERGLRLPRLKTLRNAVAVLTELGATPIDIERLISAWNAECVERKALGRHGPLPEPAHAVNPG